MLTIIFSYNVFMIWDDFGVSFGGQNEGKNQVEILIENGFRKTDEY